VGLAKPGAARGIVPDAVAGRTDEDVYDRHAGNVYQQALFTLHDTEMAEQVVSDVLVEECVRAADVACGHNTSGRLAASAYLRCMELAGSRAWKSRTRARRIGDCAACAGPRGLTATERGALGLVLFGGLGYRQAAVDLGLSASDMAALLRTALAKTVAAEPGSAPCQERGWP
jgi:hypothetical protein